jgi:hypothetical protein
VSVIRFLFLLAIKLYTRLVYRFDVGWVGERPKDAGWRDVRVGVILNHTSLFEPLYSGVLPVAFLWALATRGGFPGAVETMERPFVGHLFKLLVPRAVSITRRRDESWDFFLGQVASDSVFLIAPEGRMKRRDGLDRHGRPMTVRGGIVDLLRLVGTGTMLLAYSGGLHHVQAPGEGLPKPFKTLKIRLEALDIATYLASFTELDGVGAAASSASRKAIVKDLEARRDRHC